LIALEAELSQLAKLIEENFKEDEVLGLAVMNNRGEVLFSACCIDLEKFMKVINDIIKTGVNKISIKSPIGYIIVVKTKKYIFGMATKRPADHLFEELASILSK